MIGLTQEDLAARVGYSDRLIRKLESGGPVSPSMLSDVLGFYRELLEGTSNEALVPKALNKFVVNSKLRDPVEVAQDWFELAHHARDLDGVDELIHPRIRMMADGQQLVGRMAVRRRLKRILEGFDPVKITIERLTPDNDVCIAHWHAQTTHSGEFGGIQPTGKSFCIRGSLFARIERGKILEAREHWDVQELLTQLSAIS